MFVTKFLVRIDTAVSSISNIYPSLATTDNDQDDLLSEAQFLSFYRNDLYEAVDDFVKSFVQVCSSFISSFFCFLL